MKCKSCGATEVKPGSAFFEVQILRRPEPCAHCQNVAVQRTWSDFCSIDCLLEYAATTEFKTEIEEVTQKSS